MDANQFKALFYILLCSIFVTLGKNEEDFFAIIMYSVAAILMIVAIINVWAWAF